MKDLFTQNGSGTNTCDSYTRYEKCISSRI